MKIIKKIQIKYKERKPFFLFFGCLMRNKSKQKDLSDTYVKEFKRLHGANLVEPK
uniref:Uncharacterized protein n=1 Tax=Rhizophora mucronata TaxID=61149 RepID=A0A2P2Q0M1_RHIMU